MGDYERALETEIETKRLSETIIETMGDYERL